MHELKKRKGSSAQSKGYHHIDDSESFKITSVSEFDKMQEMDPTKKKRRSLCVGCGGSIQDQFILRVAPDMEWHASCLKCAECGDNLDESCTCFVRDGRTYCKRDYVRLFGTKCSKCSQGFSKNDFVMRARNKVFHIDCFRCVACSRQLIPGDEFALRDDGLFCKADNDIVERSMNNNNSPSGENLEDSKEDSIAPSNDSKSGEESTDGHSPKNCSNGSGHSRKEKGHKTTRVRTVLNEKQLHTLRTCYNANPRPDALMKEQLVEMTQLSPRVIRVWFQNKRCKDKKRSIYMKQMQQQQQEKVWFQNQRVKDKKRNSLLKQNQEELKQQGVPMVASSPVRHEPPPNLQPNPIEVQSYQAPWKALSEFAMGPGGDMEPHGQAPFQQLMSQFDDPDAIAMNGLPMHSMHHSQMCGDFGPHGMGGYGLGPMDDFHQQNSVDSDLTHPDTSSDRYSPQSH